MAISNQTRVTAQQAWGLGLANDVITILDADSGSLGVAAKTRLETELGHDQAEDFYGKLTGGTLTASTISALQTSLGDLRAANELAAACVTNT